MGTLNRRALLYTKKTTGNNDTSDRVIAALEHEEWERVDVDSEESLDLVRKNILAKPRPFHTIPLPKRITAMQHTASKINKCTLHACHVCRSSFFVGHNIGNFFLFFLLFFFSCIINKKNFILQQEVKKKKHLVMPSPASGTARRVRTSPNSSPYLSPARLLSLAMASMLRALWVIRAPFYFSYAFY